MATMVLENGLVIQKPSLMLDIDCTLLPSMSVSINQDERDLIQKAYRKLDGALAFSTGRDEHSVQSVFPDYPASVEHHAAIRLKFNGSFESLDPRQRLDSRKLASSVRPEIEKFAWIVNNARALNDPVNHSTSIVVVETKPHGLALVFNPAAARHVERIRGIAQRAYEDFGLQATHEVKTGIDAVEIMARTGRKPDAVRLFMQQDAFRGTRPVFIGDSGADEEAMRTCYEEFNGTGIAVGPHIKDGPHIGARFDTIADTWAFLRQFCGSSPR